MEALSWDLFSATYSPDLSSSHYRLFASMGHTLAEQSFDLYEDVKKWFAEWFAQKGKIFADVVFTNRPKDKENVKQAKEPTLTK